MSEQTQSVPLCVQSLSLHYGGVCALDELTLQVASGESLAIIGPNGAGKSSFVNAISGARRASAGAIYLYGEDITALAPAQRARLGIGRTHQIPRPFARLSVEDNLLLAARNGRGSRTREQPRESLAHARRRCRQLLERCGLAELADRPAGELPLLRRKRLELARALALRPRLLLLDEIGAGLIEAELRALIALILELRREVDSLVLIEHVMDVVTQCCERTAVLASGRLLALGPTAGVLTEPAVLEAYLGTPRASGASGLAGPSTLAPTINSTITITRNNTQTNENTSSASPPLLALRAAAVHYAGVRALRGVDLHIGEGEVVALLGPNGAGKTTLARAISGIVPLHAGSIWHRGERIDPLPAERISARGISQCLEGRRIFASLSVEENLRVAVPHAARRAAPERLRAAFELFPVLAPLRARPGTALSGGQQQMLAVARALMSAPQLVIFDEISLGLAPLIIESLYAALAELRRRGVAQLLIEQDVERGLAFADRAYVLSHGEVRIEGAPTAIRAAEALQELYVGVSATASSGVASLPSPPVP